MIKSERSVRTISTSSVSGSRVAFGGSTRERPKQAASGLGVSPPSTPGGNLESLIRLFGRCCESGARVAAKTTIGEVYNHAIGDHDMKKTISVAASTVVMTAGLGLASLGAAAVAQALPAPLPDYHWCPGDFWDPGWGFNWDGGRCHDDFYFDGEPHDAGHWHGQGPWRGW